MISRSLPRLLAAALLASKCAVAKPAPALSAQAGFSFDEIFARWDCSGTYCGYSSQLCCTGGSQCYTDSNDEAQCGSAPTPAPSGGHWEYYTTTYVETDLVTVTTVMSSYVSGGASSASPTAAVQCNQALNEVACGDICCASYQYCFALGKCVAAGNGGGNSPYNTPTPGPGAVTGSSNTGSAGAPIRPTSSSLLYITSTQSAVTTTVPFETPVATGANITFTQDNTSGGSGLSGGAIAGIVIGVLVAVGLLALLLFCCCIKGLLDGLLAIFGLGSRKKKRTEVVEEYERRSHHSRSGGRTWYGAAKPSRVSRKEERKSHEGRELLGIGAGLAALWAVLGLKRRHDQRRREERQQSEYSYNSSYDYTSESSASSDDRRTRQSYHTRTSRR